MCPTVKVDAFVDRRHNGGGVRRIRMLMCFFIESRCRPPQEVIPPQKYPTDSKHPLLYSPLHRRFMGGLNTPRTRDFPVGNHTHLFLLQIVLN